MDVMWLDIEHTDAKKYFTWDARKFPDSVAMTEGLAAHGCKLVTSSPSWIPTSRRTPGTGSTSIYILIIATFQIFSVTQMSCSRTPKHLVTYSD